MRKGTFYAKEIMERWKINDLDLVELIFEGLSAYDSQNNVKIRTQPDSFGFYDLFFENKAVYIEGRYLKEGRFVLPYAGNILALRKNLKTNIDKIFFLPSDIEEFERVRGIIETTQEKQEAEEELAISVPSHNKKKSAKILQFEKDLFAFANRQLKKNSNLSIPDISRMALKRGEDFLYKLKDKVLPKQETVEKYLRDIMRSHNSAH